MRRRGGAHEQRNAEQNNAEQSRNRMRLRARPRHHSDDGSGSWRTRGGTLTCNISPGVGMIVAGQRQLSCIFASARGRAPRPMAAPSARLGSTSAPRPAAGSFGPFMRRPHCAGRRWRNLCGCDRWRHGRRRSGCQRPGRRLEPHGHLAASITAGADGREYCCGYIQHGAAAGHCARTSQSPVMASSPVN